MYIIDFDDTLFDTQHYKQARMQKLLSLGVSEELFWKTYKLARNNELGEMVYSDTRHAHELEPYGFETEKVLALLSEVNVEAKRFLFSDALHFLQEIKKFNQPVILLSLGDPEIQEMKVKGTGIETFFDRMFFVNDTKLHIVQELLEHHTPEKIYFVNDKVRETKEILSSFPQVHAVLRQSPNIPKEEYEACGLLYFQTLTEILPYVQFSK